jgi:hypothetical protein
MMRLTGARCGGRSRMRRAKQDARAVVTTRAEQNARVVRERLAGAGLLRAGGLGHTYITSEKDLYARGAFPSARFL